MEKNIDNQKPPVVKLDDKKEKYKDSWLYKINLARENNPGAKRICGNCFTAIFDEGKCPNCGD